MCLEKSVTWRNFSNIYIYSLRRYVICTTLFLQMFDNGFKKAFFFNYYYFDLKRFLEVNVRIFFFWGKFHVWKVFWLCLLKFLFLCSKNKNINKNVNNPNHSKLLLLLFYLFFTFISHQYTFSKIKNKTH